MHPTIFPSKVQNCGHWQFLEEVLGQLPSLYSRKVSFLLGEICHSLDSQEPDCPRVRRAVSQCPCFPSVNLLYCWKPVLFKSEEFIFISVLPTHCGKNILHPLSPFLLFAKWQCLFAERAVAAMFSESRG